MQWVANAMQLLERLCWRLLRWAANAMRLLGRLMRWLMRVADEGGRCDAATGAAVVAADKGDCGNGWCGWCDG